MKFLHAAAFAVVLTLASVPVLSAQEPGQDKEKSKQQDQEKKKQPSQKEQAQPKPDDKAKPDTRNGKEKAKPEADRRDQAQRQDERARQDDRSATHEQQPSGRKDANRGGGHRIPDDRFRASFGTEHHFRVARRDDRRFEYGGYAFEYVEAWPADWSDDDDVYIVLIGDDYYLVNVRHSEIRLRLILVD
jgi:hypothetical protein